MVARIKDPGRARRSPQPIAGRKPRGPNQPTPAVAASKNEARKSGTWVQSQDFHAAFGLRADDKHIATVDEGGVALAAIQGLNAKVEEQQREIDI